MAIYSEYIPPNNDSGGYIPSNKTQITQKSIVSGSSPPITSIRQVSLDEYFNKRISYRKELGSQSFLEANWNSIVDKQLRSSALFGNSRTLEPSEFIRICEATFDDNETDQLEWLKLADSTFPFSIISEDEAKVVNENSLEILNLALSAGVRIILIYLLISLKKRFDNSNVPLIVGSIKAGRDVNIGSNVDNRSEGDFPKFNEIRGAKVVPSSDIESYSFSKEIPRLGYYKTFTAYIDSNNEIHVFPNHIVYFPTEKSHDQLVDNFLNAGTDNDLCSTIHYFDYSKKKRGKKEVRKLTKLLNDDNENRRLLAANSLGKKDTEESMGILLSRLQVEESEKVINAILFSALSSKEYKDRTKIYQFLSSHRVDSHFTQLAAEYATEEMIRSFLYNIDISNNPHPFFPYEFIYSIKSQISPLLILEMLSSDSDNAVQVGIKTISEIHREESIMGSINDINLKLLTLASRENEQIALAALSCLCEILSKNRIMKFLPEVLKSPYVSVRRSCLQFLHSNQINSKETWDLINRSYRTEVNQELKMELEEWINNHNILHQDNIVKRFFQVFKRSPYYDDELPPNDVLSESFGCITTIEVLALAIIGALTGYYLIQNEVGLFGVIGLLVLYLIPIGIICLAYLTSAELFRSKGVKLVIIIVFLVFIFGSYKFVLLPEIEKKIITISDEFDKNDGERWKAHNDEYSKVEIKNGSLLISVFQPNTFTWTDMNDNFFQDVTASTNCTIKRTDDELFGILFRKTDYDNWLFFGVSNMDGPMLIENISGEWTFLSISNDDKGNNLIDGVNNIKIETSNQRINCYLNGKRVITYNYQGALTTGNVGLALGSYSTPQVEIACDHFSLSASK